VRRERGPSDTVVLSIHWGSNWGDDVPHRHRRFAHRLIDDGVDRVHGHSSHHLRAIEIYRGRLILYGCGDLVDDYEGIIGHELYRPDLRLLYLVRIEAGTGRLVELSMVPMQARWLRLQHAGPTDTAWLAGTLTRVSAGPAPPVVVTDDGTLLLWPPRASRPSHVVQWAYCGSVTAGRSHRGIAGAAAPTTGKGRCRYR
jgi:poly-gamma-glutamate synthesis protein (capsule biosynthesis protein)